MVRGLGLTTHRRNRRRQKAAASTLPLSLFALIAVLAVGTLGFPFAADVLSPSPASVAWLAFPGLVAAMVAGAYLHVDFGYGDDDVDSLDLFEVALAPVIFGPRGGLTATTRSAHQKTSEPDVCLSYLQ